jgi:peroxiredoxin
VDAAREKLAVAGCSVLVVAQANPEVLSLYTNRKQWHVPIVSDPELTAYKEFGLERTSVLSFFRPVVVLKYLYGMLRGYMPKSPYAGESMLQLGGDFVLNKVRKVVFAYPSATPTDRPSVGRLLKAIRPSGA